MKTVKYYFRFLLFSFILIYFIFTSFSLVSGKNQTSKGVLVECGDYKRVFASEDYGNNFSRALFYALETAGNKANKNIKAKVTIAEGNYYLDRTLKIYSNTTLIAKNCTFILYDNMLSNGYNNKKTVAFNYDGAENIKIIGGIWNMNVPFRNAKTHSKNLNHSTFRFAHCKNILIKNCTFKNNYNCHDIELGGVNNVTIKNCKFVNDYSLNNFSIDGGRESIQIDVNTKKSFPYFKAYDLTTSENIVVENNYFENKFRGIGSHHGIIGNPYKNIVIRNNKFNNISGVAVFCIYTNNLSIYNNSMINVGAGIDLYSVSNIPSKNLINPLDFSYESTVNTIKNSYTSIYNNKIKIRNKNNYFEKPYGIRIQGSKYYSDDNVTNIKKGEYKVYNIKVFNNTVKECKDKIILKYIYE